MREFTTAEITQWALKYFELIGYKVWRNNNLAVKGRTFTGLKGVGDLTGYKRFTGVRLECEVKKKGDTMKKEQIEFLTEARQNGCDVYLATQQGSEIVVEKYQGSGDERSVASGV